MDKEAFDKLEEIKRLENNWDDEDALAINEACYLNVKAFLIKANTLDYYIPVSNISPNNNGTISIEWEKNNSDIYIEIGDTEYLFIRTYANDGSTYTIRGNNYELMGFILEGLKNFFTGN